MQVDWLPVLVTVGKAIRDSKVSVEELCAFLSSKGADVSQLEANRAVLVKDRDDIAAELKTLEP